MTDQEINIKIAALCGWTYQPTAVSEYLWLDPNKEGFKRPPNYAADLNACHDVETKTGMHFDQRWIETIVEVALQAACHTIERTDGWDWVALVSRLSARQRCEAFLRVHNQW